MPALKAIISGDATPLAREMAKVEAMASGMSRKLNSTIFNPAQKVTAQAGYADWWAKAIKEQADAAKAELDVARKEVGVKAADLSANVAGALAGKGHGGHGGVNGSAAKEALVIVRELASGNFTKAASSASILASRLNLLTLLFNPLTLSIGAFLGVLWLLDKGMKSLAPKADTLGIKSLSSNFDQFQRAAEQSKLAAHAFFDELLRGKDAADKLNDSLRHQQELNQASAEADKKKAQAQKELQMAQLERDRAQGKITDKDYNKRKMDLENKAAEEQFNRDKEAKGGEIANMVKAAMDAEDLHGKKADEVKTKQEEAQRAAQLRDENEARMNQAKENIKKAEEEIKKMGDPFSGADQRAKSAAEKTLLDQKILYNTFSDAHPDLALDAQSKEAEKNRAQDELAKLKRQSDDLNQRANEAHDTNKEWQKGERAKLDADKQRREVERQTADQRGMSFAGPVTNNQRVGGYIGAAGGATALIDVNKAMHSTLRNMDQKLGKLCDKDSSSRRPLGGVQY